MALKKYSKKTIALAVVAAVVAVVGVLHPEYVDTVSGILTSIVNSGAFNE
jgi:hypothetical protein